MVFFRAALRGRPHWVKLLQPCFSHCHWLQCTVHESTARQSLVLPSFEHATSSCFTILPSVSLASPPQRETTLLLFRSLEDQQAHTNSRFRSADDPRAKIAVRVNKYHACSPITAKEYSGASGVIPGSSVAGVLTRFSLTEAKDYGRKRAMCIDTVCVRLAPVTSLLLLARCVHATETATFLSPHSLVFR